MTAPAAPAAMTAPAAPAVPTAGAIVAAIIAAVASAVNAAVSTTTTTVATTIAAATTSSVATTTTAANLLLVIGRYDDRGDALLCPCWWLISHRCRELTAPFVWRPGVDTSDLAVAHEWRRLLLLLFDDLFREPVTERAAVVRRQWLLRDALLMAEPLDATRLTPRLLRRRT